jgi:hypothetical protein
MIIMIIMIIMIMIIMMIMMIMTMITIIIIKALLLLFTITWGRMIHYKSLVIIIIHWFWFCIGFEKWMNPRTRRVDLLTQGLIEKWMI